MIPCLSRLSFSFRLLSAFIFFSLISPAFASENAADTAFKGPSYTDGFNNSADYRNVTTLNDFTLLVYRDRWKDIRYSYVIEQLNQFKGAVFSPALRESWRDALLGDFAELRIRNGEEQNTLMAKRIELLNALGFFNEASRLYNEAAKIKPIPEIIATQGIQALALNGSADGACLEVYMAVQHLQSVELKKDKALCAVYFGETALAKTLYDEVKEDAGSGFKTVYHMLGKRDGKAIRVTGIPALWRTLLLARGASITSEAMKDADAMTLASIASNKHVPLGIRLNAANRAADKGAFDSDQLRKLYEAKHPENKGLDGMIADAKEGKSLPQADYYSAARFTFGGQDRAIIVKNAMARIDPVTNVKTNVYSWIVDKLTLQVKSLSWFAPEGYAVLALTNRLPSATLYFNAGKMQNTRFAIVDALLQGNPWPKAQQEIWEKAMRKYYKNNADARIQQTLDLAIAYDMENKLLLDIDSKAAANRAKNTSILRNSVRNGGRGLTLLTALNNVAETPKMSKIPSEQFIDIIDVMSKEGLFRERKKLTLEFLIQSML